MHKRRTDADAAAADQGGKRSKTASAAGARKTKGTELVASTSAADSVLGNNSSSNHNNPMSAAAAAAASAAVASFAAAVSAHGHANPHAAPMTDAQVWGGARVGMGHFLCAYLLSRGHSSMIAFNQWSIPFVSTKTHAAFS